MTQLLPATSTLSLAGVDPRSTPGWKHGKAAAERELARGATELGTLQEQLFAEAQHGTGRNVLVVLQAMDTAGKGGIVRHVFGGANPAGIHSFAFKAPTDEEKQHDFLWRIRKQLPTHGYIGVFDRSHYEDVLIARVRHLVAPDVIDWRYERIREFEKELTDGGTAVIKIMLHISSDEQKARLAERLNRPDKLWKFNPGDIDERELWPAYQEAYELAIQKTTTPDAPWFVVPADRKWYARLAVQRLVIEKLRSFDLTWPKPDYDVKEQKARLAAS
ncbi:PPK2 family polyphosphate kinase [Glaciihabitans sp. dw_435]|uniref:PPK2 family polyphosphate kinase n=1 Tax=Glaciihabitans sp. dw_435 TaxID=2720081 RepID=UPI001BD51B51|nr:PPK2 family polyphosphate kinase [Glaciihabitans sp. dw_435]